MKVFTATLATETNTFASMPTGMQAYRDFAYFPAGTHPREMSLFAGPLWAARQLAPQRGWQLAEGLVAAAQPAGPTTRSTYESLRDQLLADLKRAMPVDVVALGLIYDVRIDGSTVDIDMTLTTPGCPVSEQLPIEAGDAVRQALPQHEVNINVVWDPPWTPERLSPLALEQLGF